MMETPCTLKVADDFEEHFHLGRGQGRRGFVHDEDAGVQGQGLGDFNNLLLADAQVGDFRLGVDVRLETIEQLLRFRQLGLVIDVNAAPGYLPGDKNILCYVQIGTKV